MDTLLNKEKELKNFIKDDELKETPCKNKIFNTKLRRYLKNKINDENNFQ